MAISVRKRNGSTEPLQLSKVEHSIVKAGGSVELAGEAVLDLAGWIKDEVKGGVVTTVEIEKKVIGFIANKNSQVASAMQKFVKKAV